MRPRIALATYERSPGLAPDDRLLLGPLAAAGVDAEPAVWSDDTVLWETYDGVVLRSCWDYHLRIDEFRAWLDRLDASRIPLWNPASLVLWNHHKRYLLDLASRGVATVPTRMVPRGQGSQVPDIARAEGWETFVVKPAISASGYETHVFRGMLTEADDAHITRVAKMGDVLVQPFVPEAPRDGEYSLVFIDGTFCHAAIKRAAESEFRVQTEHGGSVAATTASDHMIEQCARILAALDVMPLYARIDGILRGNAFLLMELELIEPNLFMEFSAQSPARFADALAARLRDA